MDDKIEQNSFSYVNLDSTEFKRVQKEFKYMISSIINSLSDAIRILFLKRILVAFKNELNSLCYLEKHKIKMIF